MAIMSYSLNQRTPPPYERERPIAKLFNSRDGAYQKIIQQLTRLLPEDVAQEVKEKGRSLL